MQNVNKLKYLLTFYLGVLSLLLLSVIAIPWVIQHGLSVSQHLVIEEETLEVILILLLFVISFFIFRGFNHTLKAYKQSVALAAADKSKLISRLAEAFNYIGSVNVEIQEIQAILCGPDDYPRTKKEFNHVVQSLGRKAMTFTGTPWIVIRMIQKESCRTTKEFIFEHHKGAFSPVPISNRALLEGSRIKGMMTIGRRRDHQDFITVCILPLVSLSEEAGILMTAILNQIEMLFMLYRAGCPCQISINPTYKELSHDYH